MRHVVVVPILHDIAIMFRYLCIIAVGIMATVNACAQPDLPNIACVRTDSGVVLSWKCQYDGVSSVVVRRSADSMHHYDSIGTVADVRRGIQQYRDMVPPAGRCFYKVTVVFASGLRWTSNHCSTGDTTDAATRISRYVHTNAFTGHVDVLMPPDDGKHLYSLHFFDEGGQLVLEVPVLRVSTTIIDRRNFPHRGVFRFQLYRDGEVYEAGNVNVNR